MDGKLHRGAFGAGGEIGHVCVDTSDAARVCSCGLRGCLEAYSSGTAVRKIALENGYCGEPTGAAIANAARNGDRAAAEAFAVAAEHLGRGLAVLAMLLNPERIVLGTLAVHAADLLIAPATQSLRRHAWGVSPKISKSSLPNSATGRRISPHSVLTYPAPIKRMVQCPGNTTKVQLTPSVLILKDFV